MAPSPCNLHMTDLTPTDCAFLFLTDSCNLACRHCYVSASPAGTTVMSLDVFRRAVLILGTVGISDVRLTGGEPTTHPDFLHIVGRLREMRVAIGLTTNGINLIEDERFESVLGDISRCWISIYGPTDSLHARIGGRRAPDLDVLLQWVGRRSREGHSIGISALITPGGSHSALQLIPHAIKAGVRRLRFIPLQPDGRGQMMRIAEKEWKEFPGELNELKERLRGHPLAGEFETLTLNDPFDLDRRFEFSQESCLLNNRRMWAIGPSGIIYPCCYSYGEVGREVGSVNDSRIVAILSRRMQQVAGRAPCRALTQGYWQGLDRADVSCPIGKVPLNRLRGCHTPGLDE